MAKDTKMNGSHDNVDEVTKTDLELPTEALLRIREFEKYHRDFIKALLPKAAYTKKEAVEIVKKYFEGGKK